MKRVEDSMLVDLIAEPCPFCRNRYKEEFGIGIHNSYGGDVYWYVMCSCGAQGSHAETREGAVELWNRRKLDD